MIQASEEGVPFQITGTDYPTRDGSGIRDYVHVWDLATAHLAALERFDALLAGPGTSSVINLGTGTGTTVRELVDAFNSVADRPIETVDVGRRPGDITAPTPERTRAAVPGLRSRVTRSRRASATPWTGCIRDGILSG